MNNVSFRIAEAGDLPFIVHVYNESIPDRQATADLKPVTVASKRAWFKAHDSKRPLWLVLLNGQRAGWIGLEDFYGRPAYQQTAEVSIYIDYRFHQRGLGQAALSHVLQAAPGLGLHHLLAFIFSHNRPSQRLFIRNGFSRYGHLPEVAKMDDRLRSLDILGRRV